VSPRKNISRGARVAGPTDLQLLRLSKQAGRRLENRGWRIATAESCTAGWLIKSLTDVPGSSRWVECGYVVYSNGAKMRDLAVPAGVLARHGAVSAATVKAMARGALRSSGADLTIAISGIAGPDGGTPLKPVGTVWLGSAGGQAGLRSIATLRVFPGDREAVRRQSVAFALRLILQLTVP
jgi:nicotinamide-nucleotide amidase